MRPILNFILGALCAGQVGCALSQAGSDITSTTLQAMRPNSKGYQDDTYDEDYVDHWGDVGIEARGDTPIEKESDGLTPYISSPKARAIERSLGIE